MILIAKDHPWPEYQAIDFQGVPKMYLKSASIIVMDGLTEWIRQTGDRPTHILLPVRLEMKFKASVDWALQMMIENAWDKSEQEFMGMQLVVVQSGALELLGDIPK